MFALISSCATGSPSPSAPSPPTSTAQRRACDAFEAEQRPFIERARSIGSAGVLPAPLGRCIPSARGAWALSVDAAPSRAEPRGRWSLVHIDLAGARVAVGPTLPGAPEGNLDPPALAIAPLMTFDFDGDGEEELFLRIAAVGAGLERLVAGRLWTFRGGRIERYAAARALDVEALRDVDHDGRPDLLTYAPWDAPSRLHDRCAPPVYRAHGPLLVLHARVDGSFVGDDALAIAEARSACPTIPRTIVVRAGDVVDGLGTVANVACARMRGVAAQVLIDAIDRACGADRDCAAPSPCDDPALWRRLASVEPPLRL